ncbi:MAG: hypothetical protein IJG38_04955 [Thermoguttaceae bacterium]|nr:hypothetical protein [Thermoguttaceae bacterium]
MINRLEPGARQISASGWNEIRDKVNNIVPGQNTIITGAKNPFLLYVKNNTGGSLSALSVVKLGSATYGGRAEAAFRDKAAEYGTEMNAVIPDSEENNIAILQEAVSTGGVGRAIADGCTAAFIYKDNANTTYKYAKPIREQTAYLKGSEETTNIRVLWHGSGAGKVNAYICIDATGEGAPLKVAAKMPNTDPRPEGAFILESIDTWLYADAIDSIDKKDDSDPPAIANPCGYPSDRPVIIGRCTGFDGVEDESDSSSSSNPAPEAVAIACDTREFFMINNGSSSGNSSSSGTGVSRDYYKGSLVYVSYSNGRWIPQTGSSSYDNRLMVCQRDMPANWNKEFRMPCYPPEMNYGAVPDKESGSAGGASTGFTERCGVAGGEHKFTNKRLDYHYANGRYSYEPRFIFIGLAKGGTNGYGVAVTIEGNDYNVDFPSPRSATSHPDIYEGDQITVEVDARGAEPILTAIDYPMDFAEDTVILTHNGKPGRGWEDVTDTKNSGDLNSQNGDILVWDKANDKIIAEWTVHQCTCSGGAPSSDSGSGSGGGGHTCSHGTITPVKTRAKWWRKTKTNGGTSALL